MKATTASDAKFSPRSALHDAQAAKVERYRKRRQYIDERVVWSHFIQMADAIACLHEKNIIHRDIKTANSFLAEDGSVKIGDLNVSKRMKGGLLRTQIGTPYYMSPEIWSNKPYDGSSDIWALGCLIYELCALRPPFVGDSFAQLKKGVLSGRYNPIPKTYSAELSGLIARMIRVNQRERPTIKQLLELPEVKSRRQADWFKGAAVPEKGDCNLMATIAVPANMRQITNNLPKPCFADKRPNSPEAWPATDRNREGAIAAKKAGRPVPSAAANAENVAPASNAPKATGLGAPTAKPPATHAARPTAAPLPIQPKGSAAAMHANGAPPGTRAPATKVAYGPNGHRKPLASAAVPTNVGRSAAPARPAYGAPQYGGARPSHYNQYGVRAPAAGYNRRRY